MGLEDLAVPGISAALSIIPEVGKLFLANKQRRQADELAKIKRPAFDIPSAANEALLRAKYRALATTLPGQPQIENKIGAATAGGLRYATETAASPVDALAAGSAMIGNQQNALGNLGVEAANMFDRNQASVTNQLTNYATWQDKANQWNKYQPYMEAKQAESALRYGAEANKYSGLKGVLGGVAGGMLLADERGAFNSTGGSGNKTMSTTGGAGGINTNPYNFGGINMGAESMQGLTNEQKIQQFKLKYGRMPNSWELGQTGWEQGFASQGQNPQNTIPYVGAF